MSTIVSRFVRSVLSVLSIFIYSPAMSQQPTTLVTVTGAITFADGSVTGELSRKSLLELFKRPVTDGSLPVYFGEDRTEHQKVLSCGDYFHFARLGWTAGWSTYEMKVLSVYEFACGSLAILSTAKPVRASNIEGILIGSNDLRLLSALFLPGVIEEQGEEHARLANA